MPISRRCDGSGSPRRRSSVSAWCTTPTGSRARGGASPPRKNMCRTSPSRPNAGSAAGRWRLYRSCCAFTPRRPNNPRKRCRIAGRPCPMSRSVRSPSTSGPTGSRCGRGYQAFYKVVIPAQTTAVTWARVHDPAEPMHALGAYVDGRLCGIVHYLFHRSFWTIGDYCYLQDLFVAEGMRNLGLGRALIAAVEERARTAGASRVYWLTHQGNTGDSEI